MAKPPLAKQRGPSTADLRLWAAYSETIKLLPGKTRLKFEPEPAAAGSPAPADPAAPVTKPPGRAVGPVSIGSAPAGLDKASWQKFRSGQTRATRRLDLHGHTAARAHHAVTQFIETAHTAGIRCIEIITGKGDVLARELPHWLDAPSLRSIILATAHPHAANVGSVRILLRRTRSGNMDGYAPSDPLRPR